jgi:hypothetical protein|eukprot:COSAG02_NODE_2593_length_8463_cov_4.133309_9_plen_32_part_00
MGAHSKLRPDGGCRKYRSLLVACTFTCIDDE